LFRSLMRRHGFTNPSVCRPIRRRFKPSVPFVLNPRSLNRVHFHSSVTNGASAHTSGSSEVCGTDICAQLRKIRRDAQTLKAAGGEGLHETLDNLLQEFEETIVAHKRNVKELPLANPRDIFTNGEIRFGWGN